MATSNCVSKKYFKDLNLDSKTFSLDFEDLNDCVAALLKKTKDDSGNGRDVKRR